MAKAPKPKKVAIKKVSLKTTSETTQRADKKVKYPTAGDFGFGRTGLTGKS